MNYKNYKKSRDMAWQILINEKVNALPVSVSGLSKGMGIELRYYDSTDGSDGFSTIVNGSPIISINRLAARGRKRFTAAHELGHILLGHIGNYGNLINREPSPDDNPIEQAANVFASRLLAPACVLWALKVDSAAQIAELCDISIQAAEFRMKRMTLLYERDKFLTSSLERQVYEQFIPWISSQKL